VTGAGQGIGHAIAARLAADGFDVAVNDISSKENNLGELVKKIQGHGRRSCQIIADVSEEDQVKGMIETVVKGIWWSRCCEWFIDLGSSDFVQLQLPDGCECRYHQIWCICSRKCARRIALSGVNKIDCRQSHC